MAGLVIEGLAEFEAAVAREIVELPRDVLDAQEEAAGYVRDAYKRIAPRASGRMVSSAAVVTEATGASVVVTARRSSRRYPSFPYPLVIEASKRPLSRAIAAEQEHINQRMVQVLDKAAARWGGS